MNSVQFLITLRSNIHAISLYSLSMFHFHSILSSHISLLHFIVHQKKKVKGIIASHLSSKLAIECSRWSDSKQLAENLQWNLYQNHRKNKVIQMTFLAPKMFFLSLLNTIIY